MLPGCSSRRRDAAWFALFSNCWAKRWMFNWALFFRNNHVSKILSQGEGELRMWHAIIESSYLNISFFPNLCHGLLMFWINLRLDISVHPKHTAHTRVGAGSAAACQTNQCWRFPFKAFNHYCYCSRNYKWLKLGLVYSALFIQRSNHPPLFPSATLHRYTSRPNFW
jgi:hypothetical protein